MLQYYQQYVRPYWCNALLSVVLQQPANNKSIAIAKKADCTVYHVPYSCRTKPPPPSPSGCKSLRWGISHTGSSFPVVSILYVHWCEVQADEVLWDGVYPSLPLPSPILTSIHFSFEDILEAEVYVCRDRGRQRKIWINTISQDLISLNLTNRTELQTYNCTIIIMSSFLCRFHFSIPKSCSLFTLHKSRSACKLRRKTVPHLRVDSLLNGFPVAEWHRFGSSFVQCFVAKWYILLQQKYPKKCIENCLVGTRR